MADEISITDAEHVLREFTRIFRAADRLKEAASAVVRAESESRKKMQTLKELGDKTERLKAAHVESEEALANVKTILKAADERLAGVKQQIADAEKERDLTKKAMARDLAESQKSHLATLEVMEEEKKRVAQSIQDARDQLATFHRQLEALHAGA